MNHKIYVPPIKSQGIKTKLVEWIKDSISNIKYDRWIEPFMGTGVVAFNIQPKNVVLCDNNLHLINFYNAVKNKKIIAEKVHSFLTSEGKKLLQTEGKYYYEVRDRFNDSGNPLDFLFLNRSCFNGMVRFNSKGKFNVPFCRKPNRFLPALVTKISNQIRNISQIIDYGNYSFICQDFSETIKKTNENDIIYCDPPYIGRHTDYFDSWSETNELFLNKLLQEKETFFVLSTWLKNDYRENPYIGSVWKNCFISTKQHFYHIGAKEENRNPVYEALLANFPLNTKIKTRNKLTEHLDLFHQKKMG
jgi:DNA adenine methylase